MDVHELTKLFSWCFYLPIPNLSTLAMIIKNKDLNVLCVNINSQPIYNMDNVIFNFS